MSDEADQEAKPRRPAHRRESVAEPKPEGKSLLGTAGRAAAGLAGLAAAAYGLYLLGGTRGRRDPATELPNGLNLRLEYVPWREVYYAYYLRPGRGRPIVVLHSINAVASAHEMKPLVKRLERETDRPVFVLEWIGFGHSDRPEIAYTPDLLEEQLEHFLERIVRAGSGADLIGLSLGATYAAEVARRRPALVHSLVAIEPAGLGEEPAAIGRGWGRLLFSVPGVQRAFYDRLTTPEALYEFARENLFSAEFGVPEEYVEYGVEAARVEGAFRPLDDFLSGRLFPDDVRDTFRRLRQPLLLIHATNDDRRLESYTEVSELEGRPNVRVVALPTGALPHWERPGDVADRIRELYTELDTPAANTA